MTCRHARSISPPPTSSSPAASARSWSSAGPAVARRAIASSQAASPRRRRTGRCRPATARGRPERCEPILQADARRQAGEEQPAGGQHPPHLAHHRVKVIGVTREVQHGARDDGVHRAVWPGERVDAPQPHVVRRQVRREPREELAPPHATAAGIVVDGGHVESVREEDTGGSVRCHTRRRARGDARRTGRAGAGRRDRCRCRRRRRGVDRRSRPVLPRAHAALLPGRDATDMPRRSAPNAAGDSPPKGSARRCRLCRSCLSSGWPSA